MMLVFYFIFIAVAIIIGIVIIESKVETETNVAENSVSRLNFSENIVVEAAIGAETAIMIEIKIVLSIFKRKSIPIIIKGERINLYAIVKNVINPFMLNFAVAR